AVRSVFPGLHAFLESVDRDLVEFEGFDFGRRIGGRWAGRSSRIERAGSCHRRTKGDCHRRGCAANHSSFQKSSPTAGQMFRTMIRALLHDLLLRAAHDTIAGASPARDEKSALFHPVVCWAILGLLERE